MPRIFDVGPLPEIRMPEIVDTNPIIPFDVKFLAEAGMQNQALKLRKEENQLRKDLAYAGIYDKLTTDISGLLKDATGKPLIPITQFHKDQYAKAQEIISSAIPSIGEALYTNSDVKGAYQQYSTLMSGIRNNPELKTAMAEMSTLGGFIEDYNKDRSKYDSKRVSSYFDQLSGVNTPLDPSMLVPPDLANYDSAMEEYAKAFKESNPVRTFQDYIALPIKNPYGLPLDNPKQKAALAKMQWQYTQSALVDNYIAGLKSDPRKMQWIKDYVGDTEEDLIGYAQRQVSNLVLRGPDLQELKDANGNLIGYYTIGDISNISDIESASGDSSSSSGGGGGGSNAGMSSIFSMNPGETSAFAIVEDGATSPDALLETFQATANEMAALQNSFKVMSQDRIIEGLPKMSQDPLADLAAMWQQHKGDSASFAEKIKVKDRAGNTDVEKTQQLLNTILPRYLAMDTNKVLTGNLIAAALSGGYERLKEESGYADDILEKIGITTNEAGDIVIDKTKFTFFGPTDNQEDPLRIPYKAPTWKGDDPRPFITGTRKALYNMIHEDMNTLYPEAVDRTARTLKYFHTDDDMDYKENAGLRRLENDIQDKIILNEVEFFSSNYERGKGKGMTLSYYNAAENPYGVTWNDFEMTGIAPDPVTGKMYLYGYLQSDIPDKKLQELLEDPSAGGGTVPVNVRRTKDGNKVVNPEPVLIDVSNVLNEDYWAAWGKYAQKNQIPGERYVGESSEEAGIYNFYSLGLSALEPGQSAFVKLPNGRAMVTPVKSGNEVHYQVIMAPEGVSKSEAPNGTPPRGTTSNLSNSVSAAQAPVGRDKQAPIVPSGDPALDFINSEGDITPISFNSEEDKAKIAANTAKYGRVYMANDFGLQELIKTGLRGLKLEPHDLFNMHPEFRRQYFSKENFKNIKIESNKEFPESDNMARVFPKTLLALTHMNEVTFDNYREPIIVTNVYRSREHNEAIYKAKGKDPVESRHMLGDSFDISITRGAGKEMWQELAPIYKKNPEAVKSLYENWFGTPNARLITPADDPRGHGDHLHVQIF